MRKTLGKRMNLTEWNFRVKKAVIMAAALVFGILLCFGRYPADCSRYISWNSMLRLDLLCQAAEIQKEYKNTQGIETYDKENMNAEQTGESERIRGSGQTEGSGQIEKDVLKQSAGNGLADDTEQSGSEQIQIDLEKETEEFLSELGLSELDSYLQKENLGQLTFSDLVKDLISDGLLLDFSSIGKKLKEAVLLDYTENRTVLIQILVIAVAFSILLQMTSTMQKNYISNLGFVGVYLFLMLLLLKLFLVMTGIVEGFFTRLVEFMMALQPIFCMSMVFSTGSISAGAYYQMLLLIIYIIDMVFAKILLPAVQVYMVLQLVNNMMEEERFSRIAGFLSDSVHWCVRIFTTAVLGLNIVQGLLAPGIDGLKRSTIAGAVRVVPGIGQVMNSMSEILAGSAMLIKNSVGVAALVILVVLSFLPLVKLSVFLLLYRGCAAFMEPVADKRFCAAVAALGQAAALYLKLMFYAVLLFFLTTAIICTATTLSLSI